MRTPELKQLKLSGKQIVEYLEQGTGEVVIVLHDIATLPKNYNKLINRFSKLKRVIAPALPGHGKSSELINKLKGDAAENIQETAEWLKEFADKLDLKKITIIGHSFGGAVAAYFAAKYPEMVDRLVLADAPVIQTTRTKFNKLRSALDAQLDFIWWNKTLPWQLLKNLVGNLKKTLSQFKNLSRINLSEQLQKIEAKTELYWGELDDLTSMEHVTELLIKVKNIKLRVIPKRNRSWIFDRPQVIKVKN